MSDAFDAVMADLQAEFQAALDEHHAALQAAQTAWNRGDTAALTEIRLRAHRIAGVAGLFQAGAISDAAEAVERAILDHRAEGDVAVFLDTLLEILPPLAA